MNHPAPPLDWDRLTDEGRSAWLDHLSACTDCRDRWVAEDPSRLFLLLSGCPAVDEVRESEALERLSASIRREIHTGRNTGRWYRLAAAAILTGALLLPAAAWLFRDRPAAPVPAVVAASLPLADVEVLSTPGDAQIIDLSVGDTQVVMIFDSRLEL